MGNRFWHQAVGLVGLAAVFALGSGFSVAGHRGEVGHHERPEHTYLAYDQAVADGAEYVELDLQMSRDGELVVSHDADTYRLTGEHYIIGDTNWSTLSTLRVAPGETLHSLEQLFIHYRNQPQVKFFIETKAVTENGAMERATVALVNQYHMQSRVMYQSFNRESIQAIKKMVPDAQVYLITDWGHADELVTRDQWISGYNMYSHPISLEQVQQVHDAGRKVYVWFDNDTESTENVHSVLDSGVDGVITNFVRAYTHPEPVVPSDPEPAPEDKPEPEDKPTQPDDPNTQVSQPAHGVIRVDSHGQGGVNLMRKDGSYIGRYLATGTNWKVTGALTVNGRRLLCLGGNQYIPAKYATWKHQTVTIGKQEAAVLNQAGQPTGKRLAVGTQWAASGIVEVAGKAAYHLGGDQYVLASLVN